VGNRWSPIRSGWPGVRDRGRRDRFPAATNRNPTLYATGIADLTGGRTPRLLGVTQGRSGTVMAGWLARRDDAWRAAIATASLEPFRGYATGVEQPPTRGDPGARTVSPCQTRSPRRGPSASPGPAGDPRTRGPTGDLLYLARRILRRRHARPTHDSAVGAVDRGTHHR
jgi:hypothetical protein